MRRSAGAAEARHAWLLMTPALAVILIVALVPIAATFWDALHRHDLRLPWLGRPFTGLDNFIEAAGDTRLREAAVHTLFFAGVSVPLEIGLGLSLAFAMRAAIRGRGLVRTAALLPWAVPTVVAGLIWRFMFDAQSGILAEAVRVAGIVRPSFDWFIDPIAAWVPIVLSDAWKTTPFVAIVLLAGLQTIDPALHEAARVDGAGRIRRFVTITLPLLAPALVVAATFRMLDAVRVFDLVYVMTGGGPGTATEPLSLYAFAALTQRLRFGYGAAVSIVLFGMALAIALAGVAALNRASKEASQ